MRTVRATRYLTPLREGGSVPAIMEEDDDGTCVAKFRGAAQGAKARLVAPRSTLIQPAPVHTGPCDDAAEALERLLARLVRQC